MMPKTFPYALLPLLLIWFAAGSVANAQASSRMSSRFLARGESAVLQIVTTGPHRVNGVPEVEQVAITPLGFGPIPNRTRRGRTPEFVTEFSVSSYAIGRHTIPPIEVVTESGVVATQPVEISIFNPDDLQLQEVKVGGQVMRYAAAILASKPNPFDGEAIPAEIKVYLPLEFNQKIADRGIPEYKLDGVAAWRFDLSETPNQLNLLGRPYFSLAYTSTVSPLRTGEVTIGPATLRITSRISVLDSSGPLWTFEETFLDIPALTLNSRPLPSGAPQGFENAIGRFTIDANTTATRVSEGDPVSVNVVVSGTGNLDTLSSPKLIDSEGWKVYDATQMQRGEERRLLDGSVTFEQFMRPLSLRTSIPPFRLAYFDPEAEEYYTITTAPIPLEVIPAPAKGVGLAGPPPAVGTPIERMTDILGLVPTHSLLMTGSRSLPGWFVHVVGGLLAALLGFKAFWMRFAPRLRRDPVRERRLADLRELARKRTAEDATFLKAAGSFIERWLGEKHDPELDAILAERDAVCYRAEPPQVRLDRSRRDDILRRIRRSALSVVVAGAALAFATGSVRAADLGTRATAAYESANFQEAVKLWMEAGDYSDLSPDVLYNIGNACYRMGSPGHAALYYRRALVRAPGHDEARQNLRFIERKVGSITVKRPDFQYAIATIPLAAWKSGVWAGLWITGLSLLCFPATRSGARLRIVAVCGLVTGPLLVAAGGLGWKYFPDDAEFAPIERQAVIVAPDTVLHADASRNAPEVIDAPPGSLCEIIRASGRWAYISFATNTRGWIPIDAIEKIIPDTPPGPPEIRKPKADSSSA
jgi:tetratricopeptide (TPR) repeat protein